MLTVSRFSLVFLAVFFLAAPASAASWADALFPETSKDFGSVPRGPTLSHPFRVVNTTKVPVNIANARVSCQLCTSASILKNYLEPGEETSVIVKMDTTRFNGVKTITVTVTFDKPEYQEVRLTVQANSRADFTMTPDTLSFGQVMRGATPSVTSNVTFYGNKDAQITEVRTESNYVQATIKEVKRENTGEVGYQLTAKLRGDTPVGKWFTDVWLRTNLASMPHVRVPLTVEVESALTVSPDAVSMGQLQVGGEVERRVIVRGAKTFKISSIEGAEGLVVEDNAKEGQRVHVLTVKLKAGKAGDLKRTVRVVTDLEEDGAVEFQVSAQVK
jgi:hypothetical protein